MFQPSSQCSEPPGFEDYALSDGSIVKLKVINPAGGSAKQLVVCDLCGKPIEKSATGSLSYFRTHRASKKCKKAQRAKETADIRREAHSVRESMVRSKMKPSIGLTQLSASRRYRMTIAALIAYSQSIS